MTVSAPEEQEEEEQKQEEEEGGGGEEGGQDPGGESLTLGQLAELTDVGAPERERKLTDGALVLQARQAGQELRQPGEVTAALQRVPAQLQSGQLSPGQTVRPQHAQGVLAEINCAQLQGGTETDGELAQAGVLLELQSLQAGEPGQAVLLYVLQEGTLGDFQ